MIVSTIVSIIVSLGWSQVMIRLIRNNKADWNDFKTKPILWLRCLLVAILSGLVVLPFVGLFIGALIFGFLSAQSDSNIIIPVILGVLGFVGIIWIRIRMMFMSLIVVDYQDLDIIDLFKKSFYMTKGHVWKLIKLGFWQFLVFMAGGIVTGKQIGRAHV